MAPTAPAAHPARPRTMRRAFRRHERAIWHAVALLAGALFFIPFIWLILTAFVRYGGLDLGFAGGLTFGNFTGLFHGSAISDALGEGVGAALLNSLYLSTATTIVTTAVAILAGYPLARFRLPGSDAIVYAIVFVAGLPIIAIVIPTYDLFVACGFVGSRLWTALFMAATSLPFSVWIARNFIDAVPVELEEAAATEGAGILATLRYVTVPLVLPGALVIALYTFIQSWSNFFVPFILLDSPKLPASVTIYQFFGQNTVNYGGVAAFSLLFSALPALLYVVLSKWGGGSSIFSGAVKG
ncbi:MAG TPA: carbohydrate ABC transporter permease [Acetobacteraceae bacterium]|nr:carbohydrate ABC transporter permease [Acetobacteraceae bacterium]